MAASINSTENDSNSGIEETVVLLLAAVATTLSHPANKTKQRNKDQCALCVRIKDWIECKDQFMLHMHNYCKVLQVKDPTVILYISFSAHLTMKV